MSSRLGGVSGVRALGRAAVKSTSSLAKGGYLRVYGATRRCLDEGCLSKQARREFTASNAGKSEFNAISSAACRVHGGRVRQPDTDGLDKDAAKK